jgi:hypothetical protein
LDEKEKPKKLISRILEFAAMFWLSTWLIRIGVSYILDVWWVLLIIAAVVVAVIIGIRIWKSRHW